MLEDLYFWQEAPLVVLMKMVWLRRRVLTDEISKLLAGARYYLGGYA